MPLTADELRDRANELGPWYGKFVSHSGVPFGDGHVQIDTERTTYIRECIEKLGGSVKSAVDLGSFEGYLSVQVAGWPGVKRVVGLEARADNVAKANLVNEALGYESVKFYVYDLEQLGRAPLPEIGPFDLIICAGLLYHMTRPWDVVEWMSENCTKYLFLDTHYAELPLSRCGPYLGEVYPEISSVVSGQKTYAFWPTLGDLMLMLLQHHFVPRFIYRFSAGHHFEPRVWIFAEKEISSAELNGINILRPEARENFPPIADGPQPSEFHALNGVATRIKSGVLPAADVELARTLASRSWRLTAPLRNLNAILAKLRNRR